jgi:hypothetical protein
VSVAAKIISHGEETNENGTGPVKFRPCPNGQSPPSKNQHREAPWDHPDAYRLPMKQLELVPKSRMKGIFYIRITVQTHHQDRWIFIKYRSRPIATMIIHLQNGHLLNARILTLYPQKLSCAA